MGAFIPNLDPGDAARVVENPGKSNCLPACPGGRTIMVEPHLVDQARLTLAREKVVPGSGVGFMDLFATPSLGETEFQQNVKYRIAQEGELARLISTLDAVRSASPLHSRKKACLLKTRKKPLPGFAERLTRTFPGSG